MEQIILFAFLALFPLGQIVKIGVINPIDLVVGMGAFYVFARRLPKPAVFRYFETFLLAAVFSWILGAVILGRREVFYGLLYLIRLFAYFYFFILVWNFVKEKISNSNLLFDSLFWLSVFSGVFGWIQYFFYPDMRAFLEYGWDEHLYRMTGTFLDPSFLGLILVLGAVIALAKKKPGWFWFLSLSVLFTYSRASYLAFASGVILTDSKVLPAVKKVLFLCLFLFFIFILPRPGGEGVRLERTASIEARIGNYQETFAVIRKNPLFGVGFNNLCLAGNGNFKSHSCSGADSSILFVLATTGIVGFLGFAYLLWGVWAHSGWIVRSAGVSILIHSFFSNSVFYPFVLGYFLILLSARLRERSYK